MTQKFGEYLRPYIESGELDRVVHAALPESSKWDESDVSWANRILPRHEWLAGGEYIALDGDSDNVQYLKESVPLTDCQFTLMRDCDLPGAYLAGQLENVGPVVFLDLSELVNRNGVQFTHLFENNGRPISELPRATWRRNN